MKMTCTHCGNLGLAADMLRMADGQWHPSCARQTLSAEYVPGIGWMAVTAWGRMGNCQTRGEALHMARDYTMKRVRELRAAATPKG